MILFDHPIWPALSIYAHYSEARGNVDILQLPDDLRDSAKAIETECVACGKTIHPLRARMKSKRSRIANAEEKRLFYSATCPSEIDPGCSRSRAAKDHKMLVRKLLGITADEKYTVKMVDSSGQVLCRTWAVTGASTGFVLPKGTSEILIEWDR